MKGWQSNRILFPNVWLKKRTCFLLDFLGCVGAPVTDASGEVQAGLLQVGLKTGLPGDAAALGAHVRCFVFVDPLVGGDGARVGQHHGGRALRARLQQRRTSESD